MPHSQIWDHCMPVTVNGTSAGFVGVSNNYTVLVGTIVNLYSAGAGSLECVVTEVQDPVGANQMIGLRARATTKVDPHKVDYGRTSLSAWTVAGSATVNVERQIVPVDILYRSIPGR